MDMDKGPLEFQSKGRRGVYTLMTFKVKDMVCRVCGLDDDDDDDQARLSC